MMNAELAFQQFSSLPEKLQFQVLDYIDFLSVKYSRKKKSAKQTKTFNAISLKTKDFKFDREEANER